MKNDKRMIREFALHLLKEYGYEGEWNIEDIQNFTSKTFGVKWIKHGADKKYGVTFKPDETKATEYGMYSKNIVVLIETAVWRFHSGDQKKEN